MLDKLKNFFKKPEPVKVEEPKPKKERKPKQKKPEPVLSAKEQATLNNEPYIAILKVDLDPNNMSNGAFELDWNEKFIVNLIRAGYKQREDDTDQIIVDRWFTQTCRNVALELYEQQVADPEKRNDIRVIQSRDIGNGRSEVS